jgi:hypothetical protein
MPKLKTKSQEALQDDGNWQDKGKAQRQAARNDQADNEIRPRGPPPHPLILGQSDASIVKKYMPYDR